MAETARTLQLVFNKEEQDLLTEKLDNLITGFVLDHLHSQGWSHIDIEERLMDVTSELKHIGIKDKAEVKFNICFTIKEPIDG